MFRYRSSVLHKSKKILNNPFFLFFGIDRSSNFKSYLEWQYERTKYIISQHTSFTAAISTERVNCIQLMQQLYSIQLLLLFKIFRHSIYVLMIIVLYYFINLALNIGVSTSIDTRNWHLWYYSVSTVNETFDPCDVTARSGSHLVTS